MFKDEEKLIDEGGVRKALKDVEGQLNSTPNDPVAIGAQCPHESAVPLCKSREFDNLKVFYHPTYLNRPDTPASWSFYIARPGKPPSDCINYQKEGIVISVWDPVSKAWCDCRGFLVVQRGDRVRIAYTVGEDRRVHELTFPTGDPPCPVSYLKK